VTHLGQISLHFAPKKTPSDCPLPVSDTPRFGPDGPVRSRICNRRRVSSAETRLDQKGQDHVTIMLLHLFGQSQAKRLLGWGWIWPPQPSFSPLS